MMRGLILLTLLTAAALVTACGQKGPLRLPEPARESTQPSGTAKPTSSQASSVPRGESK
jgi:predicted small lipoprotein YifL